jgi:hypothetical protein
LPIVSAMILRPFLSRASKVTQQQSRRALDERFLRHTLERLGPAASCRQAAVAVKSIND